jgi:hypothetical protein
MYLQGLRMLCVLFIYGALQGYKRVINIKKNSNATYNNLYFQKT